MQFELTKEFINNLISALESEDNSYIVEAINPLHPADIAEILEIVNLPQAQYLYQLLDEELASEVLVAKPSFKPLSRAWRTMLAAPGRSKIFSLDIKRSNIIVFL